MEIATPLLDRANRKPPHWSDGEIRAWDAHGFRILEPFITGRSTLHGVTVTDHRVDWEFYRRYKTLQVVCAERRLPYQFMRGQELISRSDTGGWRLDEFKPHILAINYEARTEEQLDCGGAGRLLGMLRGRRHRRFWPWGKG